MPTSPFVRPLTLAVLFASLGLMRAPADDDVLVPEVLHGFAASLPHFGTGAVPGDDGNFYGVTERGGHDEGTVFRVTPAGVVTVLVEFGDPSSEARGQRPVGPLVFDGAGKFYGVTQYGGRGYSGTIFRVSEAGVIETLVDFSGRAEGASPGDKPDAALTLGSDGNFYGTTRNGGTDSNDYGSVFRLSPQGRYEQLAVFTGASGALPGDNPDSQLLVLPDGSMAGTTQEGGKFGRGTIFVIDQTGRSLRSISFAPTTTSTTLGGREHFGGMVCTPDGTIYGLLRDDNFKVHIWQLSASGPSLVVDLDNDSNNDPISDVAAGLALTSGGDLVFAANYDNSTYGGLYGVNTSTGIITKLGSFPAWQGRVTYDYADFLILSDGGTGFIGSHFGILYRATAGGVITELARPNPDGGTGLGICPAAPVVFGTSGTLYGYCREGGANDNGTIFQLPTTGSLSALASLPARLGFNYNNNFPEPTLDASDNVLLPAQGANKAGAILKVDSSGIVSELASFDFSPPNDFAQSPYGQLTPDGTGGFYGVAQPAGDIQQSPNAGTIFHLSSGNVLSRVGDVPKVPGTDAFAAPDGHVTLDASGNLLGIFGTAEDSNTAGFIYRLTPGGVLTHVIDFPNPPNGAGAYKPIGPLVREGAANSFIFPSEGQGGDFRGDQLFRLTTAGTLQSLLSFDVAVPRSSNLSGLSDPAAPLVRTADGTIYGITQNGGEASSGLIYRLTPSGVFTGLYSFRPGKADENPGYPHNQSERGAASLTLGPDGFIYGTTNQGGPAGGGAVFRFATAPQATGTTLAATNITAHSVTLNGSITDNGYSGTFRFTGGVIGEPDHPDSGNPETFAGFTGTQTFSVTPTDLQGHRDYHFEFHFTVGTGADAITVDGPSLNFTTPNGAPQPQDDTILVTAASGDFPGMVTSNDIDLDDDTITIQSIATQPSFGTVTVSADGKSLVYTPGAGFLAAKQDSFTYTVTDNYTADPLTASATVHVLLDSTVTGEYAGLLIDAPEGAAIPRDAAALPTPDQIAAGFARISVAAGRSFTARFGIGKRTVPVKGRLLADRDTTVRGDRSRLSGSIRPLPSGTTGTITYNGRTLTFIAGQGYVSGVAPAQRPVSGFTVRFTPNEVRDPILGPGLPAGSGFATIRRDAKAHAVVVGVLPDGTKFSQGSVIRTDDVFPLSAPLYADKSGVFSGEITVSPAASGEVDNAPNTTTHWMKSERSRDKRFADGFTTTLTAFGGKYTLPSPGKPPLDVAPGSTLTATFDRGGLFMPLSTPFTFTGAKPIAGPVAPDGARATLKFDTRAGTISGTFRSEKAVVKYRGVVIQRDNTCAGFFLGTADTGRVEMDF